MGEIDSGQEAAIQGDGSSSQRQRWQYRRKARRQSSANAASSAAAFEGAMAGVMIAAVRRSVCSLGQHGGMVVMRRAHLDSGRIACSVHARHHRHGRKTLQGQRQQHQPHNDGTEQVDHPSMLSHCA